MFLRRGKRIEASGKTVSFGLVYLTVLTRNGADLPEFPPDRSAPKETVLYYYPHHINDVLAKTATLNDRQILGYLRLMWHYLQSESSLHDDMELLCSISNLPEKDVKAILTRLFRRYDDCWIEPDLENILYEYRKHKEKSKEGGKKSGEVRRMKANKLGGPFGGPPIHNEGDFKGPSTVLEGVFKGTSRVVQPPLNQPITNN